MRFYVNLDEETRVYLPEREEFVSMLEDLREVYSFLLSAGGSVKLGEGVTLYAEEGGILVLSEEGREPVEVGLRDTEVDLQSLKILRRECEKVLQKLSELRKKVEELARSIAEKYDQFFSQRGIDPGGYGLLTTLGRGQVLNLQPLPKSGKELLSHVYSPNPHVHYLQLCALNMKLEELYGVIDMDLKGKLDISSETSYINP